MRPILFIAGLFFALLPYVADAQMAGGGAVPNYLPAERKIVPYQMPAPQAAAPQLQQPQQVYVMPYQPPPVMMQPPVMQAPPPQHMQAPPPSPYPSSQKRLPNFEQQVTAQKIWQKQIAEGKIAQRSPQAPMALFPSAPSPVPAATGNGFEYAYGPSAGAPLAAMEPVAPQLAAQPMMMQPVMQQSMMQAPPMQPQVMQPYTMQQPMMQQPVMMAPPGQPQYVPAPYYGQPVQQGAVQYVPQQQPVYAPPPNLRSGLASEQGRMVERPLYEIGVGLAFGLAPAYPAAEDTTFNILPFPSIIYRGDVIRADREGARAVILEDDHFELGISLNASLPTDSDEIDARRGMPDLDFLLELGPSLRTTLYRDSDEHVRFDLPLRMVIGIGGDDGIGYRGLLLHPEFKYRVQRLFGTSANAQFSLGPMFSLDGLQDYFYSVDARYATAARPAFQAEEGYMGSELGAFFGIPLDDRFRLFTGSRLSLHAGTESELSPLFKEDVTLSFLLGLSYSFYHSDEKVMVRE